MASGEHLLLPAPETVHWGFFDAALSPVLEIDSGDTITLETLSGGPNDLPPEGFFATVLPHYRAVHQGVKPDIGPHIMTGPVAVRGAEPGDVLRVDILDVELLDDWGFNLIRPLAGALPDDFPFQRRLHLTIDLNAQVITMPWGLRIPAKPFFGVMGVAPPQLWGRQTSIIPRAFGGNIDCNAFTAGTVLRLPVHVPGALFSAGDGHAVQGDGEVCLTAVETGLRGRFRLTVEKGETLKLPQGETADHLITMAFDPDLDVAARTALREMIGLICSSSSLTPEDAYRLCSLVMDLKVTQIVNQHKGVHAVLPKWALRDSA